MSYITARFIWLIILLGALFVVFFLINKRIKSQQEQLRKEIEASQERIRELRKKIRKAKQ